MKVEVKRQEDATPEMEVNTLYENPDNGCVVLCTQVCESIFKGVVIYNASKVYRGTYFTNLRKDLYREFKGEITLTQ